MSQAAKSLFVFGLYLVALSSILLVAPNWLIGLFELAPTFEVWIRVVGMLLLFLATYNILAAWTELTPFLHWSVYTRASAICFFVVFVLVGLAPPLLLLFGVIDLISAIWTRSALHYDAQHSATRRISHKERIGPH